MGKLSLPYALRGLLRWREGRLEEAAVLFQRSHEMAEQVGWSEISFQALFGLALALRDSGDFTSATDTLDRAIDLCERAGLLAQSIHATAARAVVLALADRPDAAREAAREAAQLAERMHYPIGRAAALEARGISDEDPEVADGLLAEAASAWTELDRPLEAARCRLLAGQRLLSSDPERARELPGGRRGRDRDARGAAPGAARPGPGPWITIGARGPAAAAARRLIGRAPSPWAAGYWVRSEPAMTTTLASPASAWVSGSIASRCGIFSRRPTAVASRWWPFA